MNEIKYYTQDSLEKLKKELQNLRNVERPKISAAIAEARDKGDLSENAEYDAAKEAQGLLEMKISKLQDLVANARILDKSQINADKVMIYSIVTLQRENDKTEMTYTIVQESEANIKSGKISISSPISKAIIGKAVGDSIVVQAPAGAINFKIINISR